MLSLCLSSFTAIEEAGKVLPVAPAVPGAVQKLIDDGTYQGILSNWGVDAVDEAKVNVAS